MSFGLLRAVLNGLDTVQDPAAVARELLEGGPPVESGKPIEALWDLSREIRREDDWSVLFDNSPDAILEALNRGECPGFKSQFDSCVDRWGFRVSGELLLTKPSLDEDPIQAITLVKAFVALGDEHAPATIQQVRQERAEAKLAALGESFGSALRRATLSAGVHCCEVSPQSKIHWLPRESASKQSLLYNRFRRLVLEMGDRLVRMRHLGVLTISFTCASKKLMTLLEAIRFTHRRLLLLSRVAGMHMHALIRTSRLIRWCFEKASITDRRAKLEDAQYRSGVRRRYADGNRCL